MALKSPSRGSRSNLPVPVRVTGGVLGWRKFQKQYGLIGFSLVELWSKDIALSCLLGAFAKNGFGKKTWMSEFLQDYAPPAPCGILGGVGSTGTVPSVRVYTINHFCRRQF